MVDARLRDESIALVTYEGLPNLTADDQLLAAELSLRGVRPVPVIWSDPSVRWTDFSAIVVRSCWDYFLRTEEFFAWIQRLQNEPVTVFNPAPLLRWNADKSYLRDLAAKGIPVIPTHWIDAGDEASLRDIRHRTGWSELVVKPAISGGAHQTWRASPGSDESDDARLGAMASDGAVMVQPLVDVIADEGEWSFIFIDGAYSHAVLKRPQRGDFRVQIEHGGTFEPVAPPAATIEQAAAALRGASGARGNTIYARVDGCIVDDALLLMELELIEPVLFLGTAPGSAARLADAIVRRCS